MKRLFCAKQLVSQLKLLFFLICVYKCAFKSKSPQISTTGAVSKMYDERSRSNSVPKEFRRILAEKEFSIVYWPTNLLAAMSTILGPPNAFRATGKGVLYKERISLQTDTLVIVLHGEISIETKHYCKTGIHGSMFSIPCGVLHNLRVSKNSTEGSVIIIGWFDSYNTSDIECTRKVSVAHAPNQESDEWCIPFGLKNSNRTYVPKWDENKLHLSETACLSMYIKNNYRYDTPIEDQWTPTHAHARGVCYVPLKVQDDDELFQFNDFTRSTVPVCEISPGEMRYIAPCAGYRERPCLMAIALNGSLPPTLLSEGSKMTPLIRSTTAHLNFDSNLTPRSNPRS